MRHIVRHHDVLPFLPQSRRSVHEQRFPIAPPLAAVGKAAACAVRAAFTLFLLLIAVAVPSTASFAANYTETFDSGAAPGWTVVSGSWAVAAGTANSTADGAADIAVYSGGSWATDFVYHVRINNPYNNGGNLAGAVYNYQDANNYYAVKFAPVGQLLFPPQAYLQRVFQGTTTTIAQASYSGGGPNVWFDVDVMRSGTSTTVKVNGVTVFDNVTQSELGLGKIGLVTTFTHSQFDNVVLTETNSTAPFSENFDDGIANGWTAVGGRWAVAAGTYDSTADGEADITVYNGGSWSTDFTYHVSINNPYSNWGNQAGAVYNYQDAANYYEVRFAPPGTAAQTAHLNKVIGGTRTTIADASYSGGNPNVWFNVDVIRSGTGTTVKVNGITVFDNFTQSELGAGKVGLITSFTHSQFDNVSLAFTVNDASPPAVTITSPASGAAVSGTISVTANASDNIGVAGIQFKLDGANLGVECGTPPPSPNLSCATDWNTTTASNGSHTLTAVARDGAGNTTTSAPATVTVSNAPGSGDTAPPTVAITSPASGDTVSGVILVQANASDNVGVVGVQFKYDGINFGDEDTSAPYSAYAHTQAVPNGSYTLTAVARDAAGNQTTSAPIMITVANDSPPYLPVIPGAAGYGMATPAGRGGTVYKVTNLNAYGPGSLRECIEASGPRVCLFEVSGNIDLGGGEATLDIRNPFITIAGQTAPPPGIAIINGSFTVWTHDVLVQHVRTRGGVVATRRLPLAIDNWFFTAYNIVMDHVSTAWSTDDLVMTWWGVRDVTYRHVLATGELRCTQVYFDCDGKVMLSYSGDPSDSTHPSDSNLLMRASALITGYQRMPLAGASPFVFVNNLVYNWGGVGSQLDRRVPGSGGEFVWESNHYRKGRLNSQAWSPMPILIRNSQGNTVVLGAHLYLNGNYAAPEDWTINQQWDFVDNQSGFPQSAIQVSSPGAWPTGLLPRTAANGGIFDWVLDNVGAFPRCRDSLDAKLVNDARNRTGEYLTVTSTTWPGFPQLPVNTRTLVLPPDPNGDINGDGYTNLEEWLHHMAADVEGRSC